MIKITNTGNLSIHEQIIGSFKEYILKGYLKPGDILPSVRRLAVDNGISPKTVSKAYQELENQGVIVNQQGKGAFVKDNLVWQHNETQLLRAELKDRITKLQRSGLSDDEISQMTESILAELKNAGRTDIGNDRN